MSQVLESRTYRREECAVFRKTNEAYGGLSNMAPGFPVRINGVLILTVEALYQACRFPHMPEVQRRILEQHSPMTAKMVGKPYRVDSRPDWDRVRVKIMRWCLRLKLLMHRSSFGDLLLSTGDRPIVEDSRKDDFWGALQVDSKTLAGRNVLGRLLMELREEIKGGSELRVLEPPAIPTFLLYGQAMGGLDFRTDKGIQRAETMNEDRVPPKGASEPLFPELFPESNGVDTSLTKPQRDGSEEHHLLGGVKPYAEYKESGLSWLGKVPAHWDLRRTKSSVANIVEQTFQRGSGDVYVALENIESWTGRVQPQTGKDLFTGQVKKFRSEDVLFGKLRPYLAKVTRLRCNGVCVGELFVLRPRDTTIRSDYLEQQLRTKYAIDYINSSTFGAKMPRADWQFVGNMSLVFPTLVEQEAIVRFLDWANGRLDRAIRAKRKVIALLNEQKQAIIHRAVTRGLDPSVPLKPSCIPWLGDVPQHWDIQRTKNVFRLRTQKSGLAHGKELLSIYTRIGVRPRKDLEQKGNKASSTDNYWIVRKGDLIVNKLLAWMGAVGSSDYDGVTSPAYDILMPIVPLCSDYYHHLFRTKLYLQQFKARSRGIMDMRLRLYFDQLGQIPVPFPPVNEQQAIVAHYIESTADLSASIKRLEREIDLLREYRTRLVADVVTGKLDVREAAAKLPVEESDNVSGDELAEDDSEMIEDEITEPAE